MQEKARYTNCAGYQCLENLKKDSVDLCLIYCGEENCAPGWRYGPNKRDSYVLHAVVKGKGILEIRGTTHHLTQGDLFLIPAGEEAWYEADEEDPWTYIWVGFTGIKAGEYMQKSGFSDEILIRQTENLEKLLKYVRQMLTYYHLSPTNELKRNGLLLFFISTLMDDYEQNRAYPPEQQKHQNSIHVRHAMEYINANYDKRIRIGELAEHIGVNRMYLTNSFKKTMGSSPQEYLLNFRMAKAKLFLKETDLSIGEVAERVGYPDQLAFSKMFKGHFGVSPKAYRESGENLVMKNLRPDE